MSGQAYTATRSRSGTGSHRLWLLGALAVFGSCVGSVQNGPQPQGVVALFNPAATPPEVPSPTDLVRAGGTLQIPVDPAEATTPALQALNTFLRSLDGFPPDSGPTATTFSGALDPNSISAGLLVYDATTQALLYGPSMTASGATTITPTLTNPTGSTGTATLTVSSANRWQVGHRYVVAVLSYTDSAGAAHGVVAMNGTRVLADEAFTFMRSAAPLVGLCADLNNAACACPSLASTGCKAIVGGGALSDADALQLENGRQQLTAGLGALLALPAVDRQRADVAVAWSFTISSHPFAVFDPTRGSIPFPSDLLLTDPTMAHTTVNLPAQPGETALQTQLRMGLDTLDGFSTTASVSFPIDGQALTGVPPVGLDPTTIIANPSTTPTALLVNVTPATAAQQPVYTAQAEQALLTATATQQEFAGQVQLSPQEALISDNNKYVGVLTTGIKDVNGLQLMPSTAMVLMSQTGPLVANGASVIASVPTAQAVELEALRTSLVLPTMTALGLKDGQVAALTEFRTQTITGTSGQSGLLQLAAAPYAGSVPTTVTIDQVYNNAAGLTTAGLPNLVALVYGHMTVLQLVGPLSFFTPPGTVTTIPFVLAVPKKTLVAATGAPVTIVQHGLTLWRGYALTLANGLAAKGLATIAIDVIYHGARVVCTTNSDCDAASKSTCVIPAGSVAGKCNTLPKLEPAADSAVPVLPGLGEQQPDASLPNEYFTNFSNFFAIRDNFRQHLLDLTQLVRVIHDATANGVTAQTASMTGVTLDPTHITYIGQSLGSLLGTTFMAVDPFVNLGVLSVDGGRIVDIFIDPKGGFAAGLAPVFAGLGVTLGTPQYYQLLDTLRWIIDPGDPINAAYFVRTSPLTSLVSMAANQKKKVIVQEAGMDMVIANEWTRRIGIQLGLPLDANQHLLGISGEGGASPMNVSTFFSTAMHGDIYNPAGSMQPQAITYISTGLAGAPTVTPGN